LERGDTHSQVAGDGGVAGHGFRGQVVVAVGAVEEGLAALAVGEAALQDQPRARAGLGVQRAPARGAILQVEAARGQGTRLARGGWPGDLSPRVCQACRATVPLSPARPGSVAPTMTPATAQLLHPRAENRHNSVHVDPLSTQPAQRGLGLGTPASDGALSHITQVGRDPLP